MITLRLKSENDKLYSISDLTLWNDATQLSPFCYESSTNTVNFGYGINLLSAANNAAFKAIINSEFLKIGVTISAVQWLDIASSSSSASTLSSITKTLKSFAEQNIPSVIKSSATNLMDYYFTNIVDTGLVNDLKNSVG